VLFSLVEQEIEDKMDRERFTHMLKVMTEIQKIKLAILLAAKDAPPEKRRKSRTDKKEKVSKSEKREKRRSGSSPSKAKSKK
jgi:hypothetical protein